MLTINQILQQGRYRIVNQLGQNGIGVGYEAFDTVQGSNVLLKEIRDNLGKVTTPAQLEARKMNFAKKAKTLTEMKHPSLLLVKDFFSEIDHHYLVTEFFDGNNLGELLEKDRKPFSLTDVSNWADSLLDALNYLHTLNPQIIHGEVKPQNVRLSPNGKIKLLVFNLVKSADEMNAATAGQAFDAAALPYLPLEQIWEGLDTASKKVILTNYDEKSEKILEQMPDPRSDVYALAATLYHLLTARIPADALTRSIDILEGKADPLQSPSQLNSSVPAEVSDVLMKALEIKRENRFSSAVIMRQVLRTAFVRVKEREAVAPVRQTVKVEEDSVLEIPVVEQKPVAAAPPVAPKNPEIESEQARQLELMKKQLREAEQRRSEAEQRAASAEKRLLEVEIEAEKHISFEPAAKETVAESFANEPAFMPEVVEFNAAVTDSSSDEFSTLFAEPQKEGNAFKKVAVAAVALIVLGGGGFGIWTMTQSKSGESMQNISTTNAVIPAPSVQATPPAATEPTPESTYQATSTNTEPADSPSTEAANPASNPAAAVKPKAATPTPPQTAQVKKPAATPAKTAETQKKVTLDDLLKDN
jgi:serine/threonine protein kinase